VRTIAPVSDLVDPRRAGSWFRSWLFWAGVSFGRYLKFARVRAGIMLLQILAGVAAVVGATGLLPTPPGLPGWLRYPFVFYGLVYVTLLLLSVAWWRDARLALIGILTGPILVPVLLATSFTRLLLAVPDAIQHRRHSSTEPRSGMKPTMSFRL